MHSEGEIRRAIKPMVEMFGELTTSEVKTLISEFLEFDKDDLIQSPTRNEIKIIQRVGNIVAHQNETKKIYKEGFIVDKSEIPAKFYAIKGLSGHEVPISDKEIKTRKNNIKKRKKARKNKKIDWQKINERNTTLGTKGEEFIVELEREKVSKFDTGSIDKVIHLSAKQGDGCGYDISSINDKGETIFIEVKTTSNDKDEPFYMSENEKSFFEENVGKNAFIYRVYNFDVNSMHGQYEIITAEELIKNYEFDPVTYKVRKKK